MTALTDELFAQLEGAPLQQISQQLGIGRTQAAGAVSAALPLLIGAMGKNASQPQGAEALFGALQRDHTGGGGDLGSLLGMVLGGAQSRQTDGSGMLGHIFGGQQGPGAAMGMAGGGNPTAQVRGALLGQEQQQVRRQGGLGGGLLGAVLDQDGDGQLGLGDLLKIGGGLLGGKR